MEEWMKTRFLEAVGHGRLAEVEKVLQDAARNDVAPSKLVHARDAEGRGAFHYFAAAKGGEQGLAKLLWMQGVSLEQPDAQGQRPIHAAEELGNYRAVGILAGFGARTAGLTRLKPRFEAAAAGAEETRERRFLAAVAEGRSASAAAEVRDALKGGFDAARMKRLAEAADEDGNNGWHFHARGAGGNGEEALSLMARYGDAVNKPNHAGEMPLRAAVLADNGPMTAQYLLHGARAGADRKTARADMRKLAVEAGKAGCKAAERVLVRHLLAARGKRPA